MTQLTPLHSNLGGILGIGVLGALLSALAVWLLDGPAWAVIAGYILGGMTYTMLGAFWMSRTQLHSSE